MSIDRVHVSYPIGSAYQELMGMRPCAGPLPICTCASEYTGGVCGHPPVHTLKDSPQPHWLVALGFFTLKPVPVSPSPKSSSDPAR